ncbi:hypothetical protein Poli38472_008807 [Pythium oligandrum]|uniref:Uncharacterized protein n=1 Tax=Pythium oligandrum TaxID=41045 RepID=A0A8K1FCT3_PYTOL|nr:hypothetical protein Poli38472_008807 [Pythium oligandrum]|eukprot:TMW56159.1 hypothetical protein Poli38472_008807 [Pythium oligandrum]
MPRHAKSRQPKRVVATDHWMASLVDLAQTQDIDATQLLVLHVIRILALYLYVLLTQHAIDVFECFPTTMEFMEKAVRLEEQVHNALLECVQGELTSNQFDGVIQEDRVFATLKRLFRVQKLNAASQCRLLARLLSRYLAQLQDMPIVRCEPVGNLASTLEYLARDDTTVSKALLYPLVNAIDSLAIEQRECLDAITALWSWLSTCDPTGMLLDQVIRLHHSVIFQFDTSRFGGKTIRGAEQNTLGVCFVRTLVQHADHIFRHDLGFPNSHALFDSETDDDDDEEEDNHSVTKNDSSPVTSKSSTTVLSDDDNQDGPPVVDVNEPLPAVLAVGIAAAAGTLAAALCVIFA